MPLGANLQHDRRGLCRRQPHPPPVVRHVVAPHHLLTERFIFPRQAFRKFLRIQRNRGADEARHAEEGREVRGVDSEVAYQRLGESLDCKLGR